MILDLAGVLAYIPDTMRGGKTATARHELLKFFLLTRLNGTLDVAVDGVDLIVLEGGVVRCSLARQHVGLGQVRVEAALVSILLVLIIPRRLVMLLDGAASLKIQVDVNVTRGGSARFVEHASLVGARMMRQLLLFLVRELIAHFLQAIVLLDVTARIEQDGHDVNVMTLIVDLTLSVNDGC